MAKTFEDLAEENGGIANISLPITDEKTKVIPAFDQSDVVQTPLEPIKEKSFVDNVKDTFNYVKDIKINDEPLEQPKAKTFEDLAEENGGIVEDVQPTQDTDIIKSFEGTGPIKDGKLQAYDDVGGLKTIGYGHLLSPEEKRTGKIKINNELVDISQGLSEEQASTLKNQDNQAFSTTIDNVVKVNLLPNQRKAIESLVYNIGLTAFANSTLLKKLNAGDYKGASDEFLKWNKVKGETVNGLTNRRQQEQQLFNSIDNTNNNQPKAKTFEDLAEENGGIVEDVQPTQDTAQTPTEKYTQAFNESTRPRAMANALAQGTLLGAADEASAWLATQLVNSDELKDSGLTKDELYEKVLTNLRNNMKIDDNKYPITTTAANIVGNTLPYMATGPLAKGLSKVGVGVADATAKSAGILSKIAPTVASTAAISAGQGYASGEGVDDRLGDAAIGAAIPLGLNAAGSAASKAAQYVAGRVGNFVSPVDEKLEKSVRQSFTTKSTLTPEEEIIFEKYTAGIGKKPSDEVLNKINSKLRADNIRKERMNATPEELGSDVNQFINTRASILSKDKTQQNIDKIKLNENGRIVNGIQSAVFSGLGGTFGGIPGALVGGLAGPAIAKTATDTVRKVASTAPIRKPVEKLSKRLYSEKIKKIILDENPEMSNIMPEKIQKWKRTLMSAQDANQLAASIFVLNQTDPDFRNLTSNIKTDEN